MFKNRFRKKGEPTKGFEGREHMMSYEKMDPEGSGHHIRYPEDEPHMKSRVSKEESHEMEDDYHFKNPHREQELPDHIKSNFIYDSEVKPRHRTGNLVSFSGNHIKEDEDETVDEEESEDNRHIPKEHRKDVIVAVLQRKLKKKQM